MLSYKQFLEENTLKEIEINTGFGFKKHILKQSGKKLFHGTDIKHSDPFRYMNRKIKQLQSPFVNIPDFKTDVPKVDTAIGTHFAFDPIISLKFFSHTGINYMYVYDKPKDNELVFIDNLFPEGYEKLSRKNIEDQDAIEHIINAIIFNRKIKNPNDLKKFASKRINFIKKELDFLILVHYNIAKSYTSSNTKWKSVWSKIENSKEIKEFIDEKVNSNKKNERIFKEELKKYVAMSFELFQKKVPLLGDKSEIYDIISKENLFMYFAFFLARKDLENFHERLFDKQLFLQKEFKSTSRAFIELLRIFKEKGKIGLIYNNTVSPETEGAKDKRSVVILWPEKLKNGIVYKINLSSDKIAKILGWI